MPKINQTQLITLHVLCPKCLEDTGRWMRVLAKWRPNDKGKLELVESDEMTRKSLEKFEAEVLAAHTCKEGQRVTL